MIPELKAIYCLHHADLDNMTIQDHQAIFSMIDKYWDYEKEGPWGTDQALAADILRKLLA